MKLSISNIAWTTEYDDEMYSYLQQNGCDGIEIAPTRIFYDRPYEHIAEARKWAKLLRERYGLIVSSMQSIWFGRTESIFGTNTECQTLIHYTRQAIDFAVAIGCGNIVFGCPKNRDIPNGGDIGMAADFFVNVAKYADACGVIIAIEPNPAIYGTNFINTTSQAFEFVKQLNTGGVAINIDLGAMIENREDISVIPADLNLVNHIHISEPNLAKIQQRPLHKELCEALISGCYKKYVSIEMKNPGAIDIVKQSITYVREVMGR
jgi:sugar phosphate isomerase/epimerase